MKGLLNNAVNALQGIFAALTTPDKSSSNGVTPSKSNTGITSLSSGTGNGVGGGSPFVTAAWSGQNLNQIANGKG